MKKIKVLIVDDEPLAQQGVALMIQNDPELEILGTCSDGLSSLEAIRTQRPDLVFLDAQMPQLGGIEVYRQLAPAERPAVIFITAHADYAVQAFEMCAVDYLLKPFRDTRFHAAVGRAKEQIRRSDYHEVQRRMTALLDQLRRMEGEPAAPRAELPATSRLVFKVAGEHLFLEPADLAWIEAQGELVKLCVKGAHHFVREPLHVVEKRLDPERFVRVHRSFIVNTAHIKKITPTLYGDHTILTNDGAKIRMSRTFRDKLPQLLSPRLAG